MADGRRAGHEDEVRAELHEQIAGNVGDRGAALNDAVGLIHYGIGDIDFGDGRGAPIGVAFVEDAVEIGSQQIVGLESGRHRGSPLADGREDSSKCATERSACSIAGRLGAPAMWSVSSRNQRLAFVSTKSRL